MSAHQHSPEDGGAAFPVTGGMVQGPNTDEWVRPQDGMTLRDYFAAAAVTGFGAYVANSEGAVPPERWAKRAYEIADAMIAARKQEKVDD